jgi:hypothetical protein
MATSLHNLGEGLFVMWESVTRTRVVSATVGLSSQIADLAMAARFNPESSPAADGTYELRIDDATFQFTIQRGEIEISAGQVPRPHATTSTNMATLIALNNGSTSLESALGDQSLVVDGSTDTVTSLATAFEIERRERTVGRARIGHVDLRSGYRPCPILLRSSRRSSERPHTRSAALPPATQNARRTAHARGVDE